jgi:DNA-binding NtrC family response regulator
VAEIHTLQQGGSRKRAVRGLKVEVVRGPDAGRSARADGGAVTIGTAEDNALVLTDRTVSRYHLELTATDEGVRVEDLGSSNGTYLGTARIERATVPAGTELRIGDSSVRASELAASTIEEPPAPAIDGMVAASAPMREVAAQVAKLAHSKVSVLVHGETGTGKEVVARALHESGPRRDQPFVVVDCGSMPATLIASELFGHERGAFTGADRARAGAFELAHGGTIFLDEIGELPLPVQPALLGALERRSFRRLGGQKDIAVDVRVVAATHRDLRAEVNADRFRADLYYRLAVTRVVIPPLRERVEEIEALVTHFVTELTGESVLPFGPSTIEMLKRHRWSGNVRELRNVVEAAVAMGEVKLEATKRGIGEDKPESDAIGAYKEARAAALDAFERSYLARLIQECNGNASEAARVARMDRQYLLSLLRRHGLR